VKKKGLTPKQEMFCREYMVDMIATQAAIRAGYSRKTAESMGCCLLRNPKVSARVEELKAKRAAKVDLSAEYVLGGLQEVAGRCMQKIPVMEWNPQSKSMEQAVNENGEGLWQFDSKGANRSLELLGKHLGIFVDRLHVSGSLDLDPEQRRARIAELERKRKGK